MTLPLYRTADAIESAVLRRTADIRFQWSGRFLLQVDCRFASRDARGEWVAEQARGFVEQIVEARWRELDGRPPTARCRAGIDPL